MAGLALQVAVVVVVAMVLLVFEADAYSRFGRRSSTRFPYSSSRSRGRTSFYSRYGSGSKYQSPRARFVHGYTTSGSHPHPHPPQAIGIPINIDDDNMVEDIQMVNRFLPYGFGDSLLAPIEGLLRDLAGYTGYTQQAVPNIVKNIKHEFYIGANKRDPLLHNILKRYGFMFTGNPLDLTQGNPLDLTQGNTGGQGGIGNIFNSLGLGGANANTGAGYGGVPGLGVSSVQNPMPGVNGGITDDLFDDFGKGLLGLSAATSDSATSKKEQKSSDLFGSLL